MAVAYDNGNSATGNGTTATVSLTCASSSLVVFCFWANNNPTFGSPTFDGQAPSLIYNPGNGFRVYSYRGHASGSRTATVTWTGAQDWGICAVSVTGWDSSTPIGTSQNTTNDSLTSITTPSITSATDGLIVDAVMMINGTITAGGGQTERATAKSIQGSAVSLAMSTKTGAASTTMSWSAAETFGDNYIVGVPIIAGGGGGGGSGVLLQTRQFGPQSFMRTLVTQ